MKILSKFLIFFYLLILLICSVEQKVFALSPDEAAVNGFVKDSSTGETIIGATVYLKNTPKGAFTNKSGFFAITGIIPGDYIIVVNSIGYQPYEQKVKLTKGETFRANFILNTQSIMAQEVSVTAERQVDKRQINISRVNVPIAQVKQIRIGGESDVFRSLQMLPGILTSSQVSSGLYIRGGSPDQNLVLLDGSTVYNPSHLFGFFSAFNSEAIKDVEIIKGGYPAEYGGRLSAVLNITQKDGNQNEFNGLASLGLISSKLSLEGPVGNGSWFLGGRASYLDLVMKLMPEDPENPLPSFGFYDINAKISQDIGKNDKIFLSGFISEDDFGINTRGLDMNFYLGNRAISTRWTHIFGNNLFSTVNMTFSRYVNGFDQDLSSWKAFFENSINDYTLKANLEWFATDRLTIKSGLQTTNYKFTYSQDFTGDGEKSESGTNDPGKFELIIHDWVYDAFGQANYQFNDLVSAQAGLRVSHWDKSKETVIDPRMSAKWQIQDNFAVKASWGVYHQYLRLSSMQDISLFDTWLPTDNTVPPSKAIHYILSFETEPIDKYELNFDFYYKDLKNISEVNMNAYEGSTVADLFYNGNGKAYGAEIFLQKRIGNLTGWIGYGLGFVYASFDSINLGKEFRPKYDRRHDLKIVMQYKLSDRWTVGGNFTFQSGQSYTGASSRMQIKLPGDNYGNGMIIPTDRYGLRLPPSHQLNLNATYHTTLFKLPFNIVLDIYNVYSRRDILMRYYETEELQTEVKDVLLIPIIPTVSFELAF